jgi:hypothetical protein
MCLPSFAVSAAFICRPRSPHPLPTWPRAGPPSATRERPCSTPTCESARRPHGPICCSRVALLDARTASIRYSRAALLATLASSCQPPTQSCQLLAETCSFTHPLMLYDRIEALPYDLVKFLLKPLISLCSHCLLLLLCHGTICWIFYGLGPFIE